MPIHVGKDIYGSYIRYGKRTKYYFTLYDLKSFINAYNKAIKQMKAIYSNSYRDKR